MSQLMMIMKPILCTKEINFQSQIEKNRIIIL